MGIENIDVLFGDNVPNHDATDVPLVIATKNDDGPGFVSISGENELPPSDFKEGE